MSKKVEEPIDINEIDKEIENIETVETPVDSRPFGVLIEEARKDLFNEYSKSRKTSNIVLLITVALIIACFILISNNNTVLQIIGYVLGGAVVVGMIIYYILTKNTFPNKTKEYIKNVVTSCNSFNYDAIEYKDIFCDHDEKLELAEIIADKIFENPNQTSSRNVVRGKYLNHSFKTADAAIYSGSGKTRVTNFVGKYIVIGNDLHFEGRIVLNKQSLEKPVDLPNGVSDLTKHFDTEIFKIYAPENLDYKNVLNKDFIKTIENIEIDETLLNLTVVVWAGHTAIYASYSDAVIALPFDKEFNPIPMETFKRQQKELLQAACDLFEK